MKWTSKFSIVFALYFICNAITAQSLENLNFDKITKQNLPIGWYAGNGGVKEGYYKVSIEKKDTHSGKYCVKIQLDTIKLEKNFGVITGTMQCNLVAGKNLVFKGWIKTKKIQDGYAGLWLRVNDKDGKIISFDNMHDRGLSNTNKWTEVSIEVHIAKNAKNINFGGIFNGKGVAWFDNFSFYIDGVAYK